MRWFAGMVIVLPLLVGGSPPRVESKYPRLEDCPFTVDPNLVQGKLLACLQVELGRQLVHTRTWYDPDGDPVEVKIIKGPVGVRIVNRPKAGSDTILWTPRQIITTATVVQATDQPAHGEPLSDVGTILVQVVPRGRQVTPRGCGGPPQ